MKKKLIYLSLLVSIMLTSCGGKAITEVKTGMTEAQVKEMLGEANGTSSNSSSSSMNGEENSITSSAEWSYDGKGKIYFENGKVTKVEAQ